MGEAIYKNVKINETVHRQIKKVSVETGINVGKLVEMGVMQVVEEYHNGGFDKLIANNNRRLRRDGALSRS
jgi:hypothetical protein